MVVLARPEDAMARLGVTEVRAPWQTRFARLPAAPPPGRRVEPIAIPVIGARPIEGRRLVRAPWAEPLAAFAGVVVETQHVPDAWLDPRMGRRPSVAIPVVSEPDSGLPPRRLTPIAPQPVAEPRAFVAIPIAVPIAAGGGAVVATEGSARIIPFPAPASTSGPDPRPTAAAALSEPEMLPAAATPSAAHDAPHPRASMPAPTPTGLRPRRGFIARTLTLALVLVGSISLLARR